MTRYEKIKQLAKEKGVTITGLEKELGFARGSLSKIDKNKPSIDRLEKLSNYFNIRIDFFIEDDEKGGEGKYYQDQEAVYLNQTIFDNPDLHALMDAAKDCKPEYIKSAVQLLKTLKETNPDG